MSEQRSWDDLYEGSPAWDIGKPQPPIRALAETGKLTGRVLDAGCGTGEHALMASQYGHDSYGIDISSRAIELARRKASERRLDATFQVGDALHLETLGLEFNTIIDSGLFHVLDDADRAEYVASLGRVLAGGGFCYLMCFSDRQPGTMGPRRITRDDLRQAFAEGWSVEAIEATQFLVVREPGTAEAWLATLRRK